MNRSTPGLPVCHQLLEFTQTHVHWVNDVIQPSHPLSSPSSPTINLSLHQGLFKHNACVHAKSLQMCLTLYNPVDCRPPDSSVPGILQARILEWLAIPSSRGSSQPKDQTRISCIAGRLSSEPPGKCLSKVVPSYYFLSDFFNGIVTVYKAMRSETLSFLFTIVSQHLA